MAKIATHFITVFLLMGLFSPIWADHPTEGKVAIDQLLTEAELTSLQIKSEQEKLNSLREKYLSSYGRFSPKISLEGGPQSTKFADEKSNASSLYGKLEWNIYNGGADESALEQSKNDLDTQEKILRNIKNHLKQEVSKVYYQLQYLLESISLKEKALELNSQQMKIAKAKNRSGFTSSSDVLEFDLRESTLQSDLVLLNQQLAETNRNLDVLLSRPMDKRTDNQGRQTGRESVKGHLQRESFPLHREQLLEKILTYNSQRLQTKTELRELESEKNKTLSQFLPKLDFEAKYGKLANEEKIFDGNSNYSILLRINLPLFSGLEDYNSLKSSNAKIAASRLKLEQQGLSLAAELDSILAEVTALNARLDLEEKNLERSERYYMLTLEEYRRGVKNSPDMVVASERMIDAKIRNLEYRRDLMLAYAKIQELSGE